MKPIHKFNGGRGATLCHKCSVIITVGLTDDLYCERCMDLQNKTMSQQTAVDWLVDQLTTMGYIYAPHFGKAIIDKTIEKAQEKQKEQLKSMFESGRIFQVTGLDSFTEVYNKLYGTSNGG